MAISTPSGQSKTSSKWKAFRPLIGAALLIGIFGGMRLHQNLSRDTRLFFQITLDGRQIGGIQVACDGKVISSGDAVRIGLHRLTIHHPKAQPVQTNFFQFYGRKELSPIDLKRAAGVLTVTLSRPAQSVAIFGDDFKTNISNTSTLSTVIPTGDYVVSAAYRHHNVRQTVTVAEGATKTVRLEPRLGSLAIAANQEGSTFQLLRDGSALSDGSLPANIDELPEGEYQVKVTHRGNIWNATAKVSPDSTNNVQAHFAYGALVLESNPSGATITDDSGRSWGKSPLSITDLTPGSKKFVLRKEGFESVEVTVAIEEGTTNRLTKRLVSFDLLRALSDAKSAFQRNSFDEAIAATQLALRIDASSNEAKNLLVAASLSRGLLRAEAFGAKGQFSEGISEAKAVLTIAPENSRAKSLVSEFQTLAAQKAEGDRAKRLVRAKTMFTSLCDRTPDTGLFETIEFRTRKPIQEVESLIVGSLQNEPSLTIKGKASGLKEAFEVVAEHEFMTPLKTSAGKRVLLIVGAQVKDDETHVLFKVLEYKTEAVNKFSIGNLIGASVAVNYRPIQPDANAAPDDKFQIRLRDGKSELKTRFGNALGTQIVAR